MEVENDEQIWKLLAYFKSLWDINVIGRLRVIVVSIRINQKLYGSNYS
jgi:hypothetical protein